MTPTPSSPPASDAAIAPTSTGQPSPIPVPKHEVYGFVPYWEMDDTIAAHIAATDLTTLGLFSVTHQRNGRLQKQTGLQRIEGDIGRSMIRAAHDRGTRVEIVYTSFGATKNRRFYDDPKAQDRWIDELVGLVQALGRRRDQRRCRGDPDRPRAAVRGVRRPVADGAPRPHPGRAALRGDPGQRDRRRDGGGRCDRGRGSDLPDGLRLPDSRHAARRIGAHRSDGRQGQGPRLVARPVRDARRPVRAAPARAAAVRRDVAGDRPRVPRAIERARRRLGPPPEPPCVRGPDVCTDL